MSDVRDTPVMHDVLPLSAWCSCIFFLPCPGLSMVVCFPLPRLEARVIRGPGFLLALALVFLPS